MPLRAVKKFGRSEMVSGKPLAGDWHSVGPQ